MSKAVARLMLVLGLAMILSFTVYADDVYKVVDEDGNVTYSDKPSKGSEKVDLPPLQEYKAPPLPDSPIEEETSVPSGTTQPVRVPYTKLEIISPKHQEDVRDNAGNLTILTNVEPELQKGDRMRLMMDGRPIAGPDETTTFYLSNVERGSHQLFVQILAPNGRPVINSKTINFTMLRYSAQTTIGTPSLPR